MPQDSPLLWSGGPARSWVHITSSSAFLGNALFEVFVGELQKGGEVEQVRKSEELLSLTTTARSRAVLVLLLVFFADVQQMPTSKFPPAQAFLIFF